MRPPPPGRRRPRRAPRSHAHLGEQRVDGHPDLPVAGALLEHAGRPARRLHVERVALHQPPEGRRLRPVGLAGGHGADHEQVAPALVALRVARLAAPLLHERQQDRDHVVERLLELRRVAAERHRREEDDEVAGHPALGDLAPVVVVRAHAGRLRPALEAACAPGDLVVAQASSRRRPSRLRPGRRPARRAPGPGSARRRGARPGAGRRRSGSAFIRSPPGPDGPSGSSPRRRRAAPRGAARAWRWSRRTTRCTPCCCAVRSSRS